MHLLSKGPEANFITASQLGVHQGRGWDPREIEDPLSAQKELFEDKYALTDTNRSEQSKTLPLN